MAAQRNVPKGAPVKDHFQLLQAALLSKLDCERVTIWLIDYAKHVYVSTAGTNDIAEIAVPFGKGIVGAVAQSGSSRCVHDAQNDPSFDDSVDKQTGYKTRNLLAVPFFQYDHAFTEDSIRYFPTIRLLV